MIFTYWKLSIKRKMLHDNTIQRDDLHWTIYSSLSSLYFSCFPLQSLCRESLGGPLQIFKTKQAFHVFLLWSFSSKTHARMHSDTLTGGRSQCCGWPPWPVVWFTECEAPQQRVVNSAALTCHTFPPHIWPAKQAAPKHSKQTQNNPLFASISTVLIEVGTTWCTLRQKFANWRNRSLWSSEDTMKCHYLRTKKN